MNSKRKGNSFERAIAKLFTARFGIHFKRTPSSGAFVGGSNREKNQDLVEGAKMALSGDVSAMGDDSFAFSVELKSYSDEPKFHQIIQGESKILDKWLEQAEGDAAFVGKAPLLVFKLSRKGEYAVFNQDLPDINLDGVSYISYKNKYIVELDNFLHQVLGQSYNRTVEDE